MTNAKEETASAFLKAARRSYESNLAFQMQPQYQWKELARVTFGWSGGSPKKYYENFSRGR